MKKSIDLNCDMGESFGAWQMGRDAEIMPFISSANIACGFHGGDPVVIRKTIDLAVEFGVAVGAHPSYPDIQGFGRRSMALSASEVYDLVIYQVSALKGISEAAGTRLHHVKPHGALYNDAAKDKKLAAAIANAVRACDAELILYGLSGSLLVSEAKEAGLKAACEVFSDRTYQKDGTLTPRSETNALIAETDTAVNQVVELVQDGFVTATNGTRVRIDADSVCIHGDGVHAVEFAKSINQRLVEAGIEIKAIQ